MPNALLKLPVKDKLLYSVYFTASTLQRLLYSGKVHERREEGKRNLRGERNEVTADERQTGS